MGYIYDNGVKAPVATKKDPLITPGEKLKIFKIVSAQHKATVASTTRHPEFEDDCYPEGTDWDGINGGPYIEILRFTKGGKGFLHQTICRNEASWKRAQKFFEWSVQNGQAAHPETNLSQIAVWQQTGKDRYRFRTAATPVDKGDHGTLSWQILTVYPDRLVVSWDFPASWYQTRCHLAFPEMMRPRIFRFYPDKVTPEGFR